MSISIERLPVLLALLLAVAMVAATSWQGYDIYQSETSLSLDATSTSAEPAIPQRREPPAVQLASLELFGTADQEAAATPEDTENLPETNLRLKLRGVLAAEGEFPGSALIEDDKSETEVFLVGDQLPGNATLRSVHSNRVIIERNGALENLYFPEERATEEMAVASASASPSASTGVSQPAPTRSTQSRAGSMTQQERREEVRRRLEELRNRLRNND
jgi:general secretion pathway protein C